MTLPVAIVSDRARKRLKNKHPWIFSNEIDSKPEADSGQLVRVQDREGHFVGTGYYNPHTLIAIRILAAHSEFDLKDRVQKALDHRQRFYKQPLYRLIYSESDGLPGLIVDRYLDTLVAQILTAGMERMRMEIVSTLIEVVKPKRILLRNDSPYRTLEGLPLTTEWILGDPLGQEIVEMDGLKFEVNYEQGQKTGFFLDQQRNRNELVRFNQGKTMLDAFCYSGAWALYGAKSGFLEITAVDSSQDALAAVRRNSLLNGFAIETIAEDVFEFLRNQYNNPKRYDLIVLDPPAFCKSKRHLLQSIKGYREINLRAMKLLNTGGVLITCSCSQPVTTELFLDILKEAAKNSGRSFHLREVPFQPPDHPVLLNFPESHYLKCAVLELMK